MSSCGGLLHTHRYPSRLTWHIHIGGPVASLVFEGANTSTVKRRVFGVQVLRKHGQQATRKGQPAVTHITHHWIYYLGPRVTED